MRRFVQELRERRVIRVAVVYAGTAFVTLQLGEILVEPFGLGAWALRLITLLLALGFPLAVGLAWVFDVTEEGLVRTASRDAAPEEEASEGAPLTSSAVRIGLLVVVLAGGGWITWTTGFGPQLERFSPEAEEGETSVPAATQREKTDPRAQNLDPARVAVLYFDDNSPGDKLAAFTEGFTEHLIHRLTQAEGLDVLSRHAVKPYRHGTVPLDSIARQLGAGSLIEGGVRESGGDLVVTVQLIDGETQSHLLSEVVQRPAEQIFALMDSLAREVSKLLRERLGREVQLEAWQAGTDRPGAWRLARRSTALREDAEQLRQKGDTKTADMLFSQADSLLSEAESIDPGWCVPDVLRARLAETQLNPYKRQWSEREHRILRKGIRHAEEALRRDSSNAEARRIRGRLHLWRSRHVDDRRRAKKLVDRAEEDLRLAVEEDPESARAWYALSELHHEGRAEFERARYYVERAQRADAYLRLPAEIHHQFFYTAVNEGSFEEASHWCQRGQDRYPERVQFWNCELMLLATQGAAEPDVDRAWELLKEIQTYADPENRTRFEAYTRPKIASVLVRAGRPDSARSVLQRARRDSLTAETYPFVAYYQAHAYLLFGDEEQALDRLARFLERIPQYTNVVANDIWFEALQGHSRFQELVHTR